MFTCLPDEKVENLFLVLLILKHENSLFTGCIWMFAVIFLLIPFIDPLPFFLMGDSVTFSKWESFVNVHGTLARGPH